MRKDKIMFTLLLILSVAVLLFAGGFYAGFKNAQSSKITKVSEIIKALKGK